jgi:hypothetical protein
MNAFQDSGALEKIARLSVHVLSLGVVGVLIMAWILTEPFIQFGERIARREKSKITN